MKGLRFNCRGPFLLTNLKAGKPPEIFDYFSSVCYPISISCNINKQFPITKINKDRGDHVNKLELIDTMKKECRISEKEAATIVDLFFDQISTALANGDRVEIRGLCSFFVKEYKSYQGRNPKTGEVVTVAPKKLPFFKIGKELRERVDY